MIRNGRTPKAAEDLLWRTLHAAHRAREATEIFDALPSLRRMATRFCWYVSPLCGPAGAPLDRSLIKALDGFKAGAKQEYRDQIRGFVEGLMPAASRLAMSRISVKTADGGWEIWQYDLPLMQLLKSHRQEGIQIRKRERGIAASSIAMLMLSYVCTQADLQLAGIEIVANGKRLG